MPTEIKTETSKKIKKKKTLDSVSGGETILNNQIKQYVLSPASKKQEMFLNSDATITLAGGAAGCFDADTEYLSATGWKKFKDYSGEQVFQYSPEDDSISLTQPTEYIKEECQSFDRMQARGLDFCLTPEHKVPYWNKDNLKVLSYAEVLARHNNSKTKGWTGQIKTTFSTKVSGFDIEEGELRLQIAAQADGRFVREGKDNYCQMRFAKERKYLRLKELCTKYNLRFKDNSWRPTTRYASGKAYEIIVWPKQATKVFDANWWKSSQEQLEIIVDEVKYWDASNLENTSGTIRYFTKIKENADFIQYAFHACGYNTSINIDSRDGCFTVNASKRGNGFRSFANKDGKCQVEHYASVDGYKYCFEVQSGFLVVRRNNKVFISGNSGKTYTLLLIALKFMQHPRATGVIFRRTSKMLTAPGSVWQEAVNMYSSVYPKGLRIRHQANEIIFPNGAILKFSHMQHESNRLDHKGGQYSFVAFDEATDFTEDMVVYLISRMRNAYVDYTPQMFLLTNPDYDSFLRSWIQDYYLDPMTGIPLPEKAGKKRYYFRQGNSMIWYDSLEAAQAVHGSSVESGLSSFTFIPANCYDNPPLLEAQPDYINKLMSLPRVERERLLHGSWFARSESSGLFKRTWVTEVSHPNIHAKKRVRAWDLAFSKPSEQYPNPDWTRGVLISKDERTKLYTIEDVASLRDRVHEVEKLIFSTAIQDGPEVTISIPQDPNASAAAYARDLQRRLGEMGFLCKLQKPIKSKITRFAPFASVAEAGYVQVVKGHWNRDFYDELEIFDGASKNKDDQVDCVSDCFTLLNKDLVIPTFNLADFSHSSGLQKLATGVTIPESGLHLTSIFN